jgi:hypothetical protein
VYTGDLVLPGGSESGEVVGRKERVHTEGTEVPQRSRSGKKEIRQSSLRAQRTLRRVGSCYLIAAICYPEI